MSRRGFILADVIVATVLLGAALAVIVGLGAAAVSSQARGERLQEAAMLLDEQLELLIAVGPEAYPGEFGTRGRCPEPFEDYEYEIDLDARAEGDPYFVTAEIFWTSFGRERSLRVETLVAPRLGDEPDPDRQPQESLERND